MPKPYALNPKHVKQEKLCMFFWSSCKLGLIGVSFTDFRRTKPVGATEDCLASLVHQYLCTLHG